MIGVVAVVAIRVGPGLAAVIGALGLLEPAAVPARTVEQAATPDSTLERAVARAGNGFVRMSFRARPGVCGDGRSISFDRTESGHWIHECDAGPVRVLLEIGAGEVRDLETFVGGRWRDVSARITDLGEVEPAVAVDYLLDLAERGSGDVAREAILAARLADGVVVWPRLLRIAKDRSRPSETRKSALFWVGQAAADRVTEELGALVRDTLEDRELREQAIFALSRRPEGEGIPALMRIARENPDAGLRKRALFWLARYDDPRVVAFFEEILTGG